ncbi:hypothetical protein M2153_003722 [Pseudomonas sp. JUb96]|nr:hypothetical protein [Pseudomonas sp. JUb96]
MITMVKGGVCPGPEYIAAISHTESPLITQ